MDKKIKYKIGASLACANQLDLGSEIRSLIDCGIDFLHIDIMDGVFVNNYCFGTNIFDYLKQFKDIEIETHLMVAKPYDKLSFFENKHIHKLSFHIEASDNPIQTLSRIKEMGMERGIVINAATSENIIYYLYDYIDYILVMAVEAGFTGQDFVSSVIEKVKAIKKELDRRHMVKDIYIDGHINSNTISLLSKAGANAFIGGSTGLFINGSTFSENYRKLKKALF
jgi:ribulose-phosphate 3-epimerase